MILVNNPGSWAYVYPPLEHAEWNGWTPTDLIFPFFLFIVGVSLVVAFTRRELAGATPSELARKALLARRAHRAGRPPAERISRYALGPPRIPGVLQRIGLVYTLTALHLPRVRAERLAGGSRPGS